MCMVVLRFVSILFLLFEKPNKQKNCAGFVLRLISIIFLNFEKGYKLKTCARFF